MDVTTVLRDTFTDHERLSPDADRVLRDVEDRLARRHAMRTRSLAITTGVAVAGAVAAGAVVLGERNDPKPTPTPVQAASSHTTAAAPAPTSRSAAPAKARVAALTMPFDLGWLPAGSVFYDAQRVNSGGSGGEYLLTVATPQGKLDVDVNQMRGTSVADAHFKSGPGAPVSIAGHAGIESANAGGRDGYQVWFRSSATQVTYVGVAHSRNAGGEAARLTTIGRKVAASLRYPGTHQVQPAFGVGFVPNGLHRIGFSVSADGTAYAFAARGAQVPGITVATNIGLDPSGTSSREVQGHPTRVVVEGGYRTLTVLHAVHGRPVQVAGRVPLAQLYHMADGLVLPR